MNSLEPKTHQQKLHLLADHLQAASDLLRELANDRILPLADDQRWYWTDKWQTMEKEADEADRRGEYSEFTSIEDAINFLHRHV